MRRMKKAGQYLLGIFAALLLCGVFSVNIVKAESQYVYDNASLLSDEEEQDLERSCTEFERNTKLHMVILTERSSGSEDCQAIADDFYDKKYPKEPNGVCFLIDMGQRQIVISTSGIMQYYMSDAEIDDILQAAQGYAKDGDYAGTFAKMITMTQECFDRGGLSDYRRRFHYSLPQNQQHGSSYFCYRSGCDRNSCLFWNLEELQTKEKPWCKELCGSETRKHQRPQGCADRPSCIDAQNPEG